MAGTNWDKLGQTGICAPIPACLHEECSTVTSQLNLRLRFFLANIPPPSQDQNQPSHDLGNYSSELKVRPPVLLPQTAVHCGRDGSEGSGRLLLTVLLDVLD